MASHDQIAKLLEHIHACHSAHLPGGRLSLFTGGHHIGYLRPALAARLAELSPDVTVQGSSVMLAPEAMPRLNELARLTGIPTRAEDFDVRVTPESESLGVLDRGALPLFGVIGVGVHVNGLVRKAGGTHLWVARRAANKKLDPGKLDHLVAGGVAAGYSPFATLLKEAGEEAGLPGALAAQAREVAVYRYDMDRPEGLRRDAIYAYDLDLPESFVPQAMDGEVESFALWPLTHVLEVLTTTDDFKFNVALVLADLLVREGVIMGAGAVAVRDALFPATAD
jgi:8-oxo-dGTP pyrophosphatase MutT (NUDIX family)